MLNHEIEEAIEAALIKRGNPKKSVLETYPADAVAGGRFNSKSTLADIERDVAGLPNDYFHHAGDDGEDIENECFGPRPNLAKIGQWHQRDAAGLRERAEAWAVKVLGKPGTRPADTGNDTAGKPKPKSSQNPWQAEKPDPLVLSAFIMRNGAKFSASLAAAAGKDIAGRPLRK